MATLIRNIFNCGEYNNYFIGGNICNAFVLGEPGSTEDFFLIGAEPERESNYPLLTGNILDSEGNVLLHLVKNMLVINPGNCSKILSDHIGYEIHDGNGKPILKIQTKFEKLPNIDKETFVTMISANFYDRNGRLVFEANSDEETGRIESNVKSAFGFSGGFGLVQGMNEQEMDIARCVLNMRGAVHRTITGQMSGQELILDGAVVINAQVSDCKVHVTTGEFALLGRNNKFKNCEFVFSGPAENISNLVVAMRKQ